MDRLVAQLRAASEPTRLRLLALCAQGELTVTELTQILGQSQPRVSRHLKLLCDGGLLDRFKEGSWAFYRLALRGEGAEMARLLVDRIDPAHPVIAHDRQRLAAIRTQRTEAAAAYFREAAKSWDAIRALYVAETEVEQAFLSLLPGGPVHDFLDVGTGTGRLLSLVAERVDRGIGIDLSRDMLAVARANLERTGATHCSVRQADMYQLSFPPESFDLVAFYMVLHYADDPLAALSEAARTLRPGGRLIVVDFAPHRQEFLRQEHAHRRLGFAEAEVKNWLTAAGLKPHGAHHLRGNPLTVTLWSADRPAVSAAASAPALAVSQGAASQG